MRLVKGNIIRNTEDLYLIDKYKADGYREDRQKATKQIEPPKQEDFIDPPKAKK